jgi:hypothetical protein
MEWSGQLHIPASLTPGKATPLPSHYNWIPSFFLCCYKPQNFASISRATSDILQKLEAVFSALDLTEIYKFAWTLKLQPPLLLRMQLLLPMFSLLLNFVMFWSDCVWKFQISN